MSHARKMPKWRITLTRNMYMRWAYCAPSPDLREYWERRAAALPKTIHNPYKWT